MAYWETELIALDTFILLVKVKRSAVKALVIIRYC